ncbi:multiple sugar transport system permease protein [Arthrobacter ulcerisalmonis]|uniref:carbohydrate ABC transporter permease n=1 Tax=Arthrobacter sp. B1I2 TaxID=3042263 RepID=UPI00278B54BF|nr:MULTISPECIES: carbohydrate ABC transporter permease [Arthrobacter]MDQ0664507.1 multiple sugar transport system permease protein [Arthrobacter ulcerisalmonis]MDQ0732422.1 multiple sugar transport system permease protein [Arthrobacter sp. B1I2]
MRSKNLTPGRVVLYVVLALGSLLMVGPFIWMILTALKSNGEVGTFSWLPTEFHWSNFVEAMDAAPFLRYFWNSLVLTLGETALTLVFCTMAGYALAKAPIRGAKGILNYFIALMMVPFQIILVPLFLLVKSIPFFGGNDILGMGGTGWLNTWWALIIPLAIAPLYTFLARQFYVTLPSELADAARVDGLGEFGIFFRIMTPLVKPALVTIGVFQIEAAWNSFLWPLIVTNSDELRPLQVGLAIFSQDPLNVQWPYLMAGATLATLPMIILFIFAQKRFVEGMASAGLKG